MDTRTKEQQNDLYLDLMYFKETKQTINELLTIRRTQAFLGTTDEDKMREIKSKALMALDNLFAEDYQN